MNLRLNSWIRSAHQSVVMAPLRALGVTRFARMLIRQIFYRRILKRGKCGQTLGGRDFLFSVSSLTEVERVLRYNECEFVDRLLASLREGDVFYDVGANIGMISLAVAGCERPGVTVHAFEPETSNAAQLEQNRQLNDLGNLSVHRLALANENKEGRLFVSGEVGTGTHSIVAEPNGPAQAQVVSFRKGDDFIDSQSQPPAVIKIDVEGAEMEVLQGMVRTLRSGQVREIFLEFHPAQVAATGWNSERLLRWMQEQGYDVCWSADRASQFHYHFRCRRYRVAEAA